MTSTRFANAAALSTLLHASAVVLLLVISFQIRNDARITPMVIEMMKGPADIADVKATIRVVVPSAPVRMSEPRRAGLPSPEVAMDSVAAPAKPTRTAALTPAPQKPLLHHPVSQPVSKPPSTRTAADASPTSLKPAPLSVPRVDTKWDFPTDHAPGSSKVAGVDPGRVATELEDYFTELRRRLRSALEVPPGANEELIATVDVMLAADGTLSNPRIVQSSGNAEFDHAVLTSIGRTRMRARPDGLTQVITIPFTTRQTPNR